jgi:HSP20 family molecular chaperone IbpA
MQKVYKTSKVTSISCRLFPEVKWAQRKDRLFVTIELADFENQKIDLTPEGTLKFQ